MTPQILDTMRELHSRVNDGIHVRLLWHERDGRLAVAVDDSRTGEAFVIAVHDRARALDIFHHPFAHAVWSGGEQAAGLAT